MKKYIKSAVITEMTVHELCDALTKIYTERFPNSAYNIGFYTGLGSFIRINLYLAGFDKNEVAHGIYGNDVFSVSGMIHFSESIYIDKSIASTNDIVPDYMELEFSSKAIMTVPSKSYLWCDYENIRVNKVKGDADKIISGFKKFVDKLYDTTVRLHNEGKLHKNAYEYYNIEDKI
jgi:hypothetical protein